MKFSIDWDRNIEGGDDIDLYAIADFGIEIDDVNVCRFREGVNRDARLSVSVYPLAEGIAADWWRIFGGRDEWYSLKKNRGGYAIPDVRLRFDGDGFDVECRPYRYANPPVFFPEDRRERLQRSDVENALKDFLTSVLCQVESSSGPESGFRAQWNAIWASLQNPEEASFCEAAGALGHDPYDVHDDIAAFIEESAKLFIGEQLIEFLGGLRTSSDRSGILDWVRRSERRPRYKSLIPAVKYAREEMRTAASASGRPWERGYRCARASRRALDMLQNERLRSVSALAKRLEAPHFSTVASVPGVAALVHTGDDGACIHLGRAQGRSKIAQAGNLFAFARAIGDAVANPPAERSVVNNLHEASRQACGRAFAAEFLAPVDEIASMLNDGRDVAMIADEFGVANEVVDRQIQNADRIRNACESEDDRRGISDSPYLARDRQSYSELPVDRGERIEKILIYLNANQIRCTYKAMGEVIGVPPQFVGLWLGKRSRKTSWVVNAKNGKPTGFHSDQMHPRLEENKYIIRSGAELEHRLRN